MTKRKGLLDVKIDVNGLLEGLSKAESHSTTMDKQPKALSDSIQISNALDVITRQRKVSGNRSRRNYRSVSCLRRSLFLL